MTLSFDLYRTDNFYDEMVAPDGSIREHAQKLYHRMKEVGPTEILRRQKESEASLLKSGITFTVYKEQVGIERIFPFDIIPRIISAKEWEVIDRGLKQRIHALNLFLADLYADAKIIRDKVIPEHVILSGDGYRKECKGFRPRHDAWVQIAGIDLIRGNDGVYAVLEDNLRTPSGVSYVLENRNLMKRVFPKLFPNARIRPVDDYPSQLLASLRQLAPEGVENPTVALLTPGIYNSAYFEHSFLAREMGIQLIEGRDLVVDEGYVKLKTTRGLKKVDVIYRRVDDDFLDPTVFRKDSVLGVPGLWEVYRRGRVALANAIGNGIADDKVVYSYVPKMIKYYLNEEPIIPNVETFVCHDEKERGYVLANLDKLVVKAANQSGGYGMLIGPHSTKAEQDEFRDKILAKPREYIAQPTISLSRVPTIVGDDIEGRHVDLRPYVLYGKETFILPGGLTRVALKKGSLVVNSSQGGGSKDTWVLADDGVNYESTEFNMIPNFSQGQSQSC
ncbi:MAG: circularly permuted type 2 ATP-grasp protein [Sumerlaeia bacterium]